MGRTSIVFCTLVMALCCPAAPLSAQQVDKAAAEFQFNDVDRQFLAEADAVDEAYEKKGLILHDPGVQAYLDSVAERVLGNRPVPENVKFQYRVLCDPMVNAFALPNGSVYITTGLLGLLENEDQLAGILGHETAHVFERHGYLENRSVRKKALTINILSIAASAVPYGPNVPQAVNIFGAAMEAGAMLTSVALVESVFGYSREKEHEADSDGLVAMTAASYDPATMGRAFQLLDDDSRLEFEPIQGFYHDHPKITERRAFAEEFAASHKSEHQSAGSEKDFLAKVAPAICADIESDLQSRRQRTAVDRATRLTKNFPDNSRYRTLLADSYRSLGANTPRPTDEERDSHGQAEHRKLYFKMTEQEEQKKLLEKPEGKAALAQNRAQAESLYKAVLDADSNYAPAHRGLGFLYEDEGRNAESAVQYQAYLDTVSGTSLDRLRIERRLAAAKKLAAVTNN